MKRFASAYIARLLLSLYTTFVVQQLWNWFVAKAFNAPMVSFWVMYGIILTIVMLTDDLASEEMNQSRWRLAFELINACVPEERRAKVDETIKSEESLFWFNFGLAIFGKLGAATVTLIVGFVIHIFLT